MARSSLRTMCLLTVVAVVATSDGFFWYGSSRKAGAERSQQPVPQYQNYRVEQQWPPPQFYDAAVPPMTVALPLAVPLPAPVAPVSSGPIKGTPVQLVPCLCPISRDDQQQSQQGYAVGAVQSQQPPSSS